MSLSGQQQRSLVAELVPHVLHQTSQQSLVHSVSLMTAGSKSYLTPPKLQSSPPFPSFFPAIYFLLSRLQAFIYSTYLALKFCLSRPDLSSYNSQGAGTVSSGSSLVSQGIGSRQHPLQEHGTDADGRGVPTGPLMCPHQLLLHTLQQSILKTSSRTLYRELSAH